MNLKVRAAILTAGFRCNADFAQRVSMDESVLSRVLNGRRKLKADQAEAWLNVLKCDPNLIKPLVR